MTSKGYSFYSFLMINTKRLARFTERARHAVLQLSLIFLLCSLIHPLHAEESKATKILTFNVLADPAHAAVRSPVLLDILDKSDADVIALQEVAPWFLLDLEKHPMSKKYHSHMVAGKWVAYGGLLILSKSPITHIVTDKLPTPSGRSYLLAETTIKGIQITVANCHLDSALAVGEIRGRQLDVYFKLLGKSENALFLGDFNFGDGEQPETDKIPKDFADSWLVTNNKDAGFTWNMEKSSMAKKGAFPMEKSRRLDRILIRSKILVPSKTEILGDTEIPGQQGVYPSDHFGLLSTLSIK